MKSPPLQKGQLEKNLRYDLHWQTFSPPRSLNNCYLQFNCCSKIKHIPVGPTPKEDSTDKDWTTMLQPIQKDDREQCEAWNQEVQNILIFVRHFLILFSDHTYTNSGGSLFCCSNGVPYRIISTSANWESRWHHERDAAFILFHSHQCFLVPKPCA